MSSNNQTGQIVSINISEAKGTTKKPVPKATIDELGVVKDAHAGPWHRQVSLLAMESIERFSADSDQTFNYGDFAENITTKGIDLTKTALLDRFTSGGVELEVTQIGKKCHGDGCAIFQQVGKCVMPKEGIFCRVIQGGDIKTNDEILYRPRPLTMRVITLSDRASQGIYEDKSGPKVIELLEAHFAGKRWHLDINSEILPDDADRLFDALEEAREARVDIVITTGGTGVGPRDMTPDVVMGLADREIPGIMEHIRLKYGAQKPNALVSRSVAAMLGQTLVYTLPGSVKAVNEYMEEILKTLEHLIVMIHGIDSH